MRTVLCCRYSRQSSMNMRDFDPLCAIGAAAGHGPNRGRCRPCLSAWNTSANHPRWRHLPCLAIPVAAIYRVHSSSLSVNCDCKPCTSSVARSSCSLLSPHLGKLVTPPIIRHSLLACISCQTSSHSKHKTPNNCCRSTGTTFKDANDYTQRKTPNIQISKQKSTTATQALSSALDNSKMITNR